MALTRHIHVTTQVEGLHRWPDASSPDGYLASPHRHLFVASVEISVHHGDRELEINAVARWVTTVLSSFANPSNCPDGPLDFGAQSCEHLAERLVAAITDRYGTHRRVRCTVAEDGILGGGVQWDPDPAEAGQ
ncbi:hypothetical protein [Micromonospora echinofusca]|uniref:6-carboxy-5,6,7,8-tetrahydropterin synthase n=1 Tax=Micromonospora echinofusca TaxID=47858 RepID=A0ABS3VM32_MICEH|nr:hypothetical protein [Micromonospora echinofusca]MBO4205584.1 hypothetical protein [Micromonospora echinofusca]